MNLNQCTAKLPERPDGCVKDMYYWHDIRFTASSSKRHQTQFNSSVRSLSTRNSVSLNFEADRSSHPPQGKAEKRKTSPEFFDGRKAELRSNELQRQPARTGVPLSSCLSAAYGMRMLAGMRENDKSACVPALR
ncbi:hypothetical protein Mp_4g09840 [Marchantia polymorpha subsp. ruderalis]|nr:hypothetical protein MARPO_0132s0027 [Marchantia polymorpha]BBN08222.1 hypothetical protein Mp_4g09840 [Marchantia polymorpha subsp. ruderalis]|eukprot:PTQ29952.1 hypothetical protein MARPO_0132s0027 [Marchantia polymorpha]